MVHNDCNDFEKLDANKLKKDYKMSREEFHRFKSDVLSQADFPTGKYGNNPDFMVHKKTGQLGIRSVKLGNKLPVYPLDGLYIQDFL